MARIGYKYYIIVKTSSGRIENDCVQCHLVRASTSQPVPTTDGSHTVFDVSKTDLLQNHVGLMVGSGVVMRAVKM